MKREPDKRWVDTPDELLAGIFDAAARVRIREDQFRRKIHDLHTHGLQSALRSMVGFFENLL